MYNRNIFRTLWCEGDLRHFYVSSSIRATKQVDIEGVREAKYPESDGLIFCILVKRVVRQF